MEINAESEMIAAVVKSDILLRTINLNKYQ